jgi:Spy/CpxP family protein refolding chaperone
MFCIALVTPLGIVHGQTPAEGIGSGDPAALLNRIKRITEQLDLTADQKSQIEKIFRSAADDLQSASQDLQNASADDKAAKFREVLGDVRQQVGGVLTDEQKTALHEKLQSLRASGTQPASGENSQGTSPQNPARTAGAAGANSGVQRTGQVLQRLKSGLDQLGLSPDQRTQVDQLIEDTQQQLQSLRSDVQNGSTDRASAAQKTQSIFINTRTKLGTILTADQQTKLHQLRPMNPLVPGSAATDRPVVSGSASAPSGKSSAGDPVVAATQPSSIPPSAPAVGQPAPDFSLKSTTGSTIDLASYKRKPLVLVLGSFTNPTFRDHAAGLESLREHYGLNVDFLVIYTRETHPTGGWEIQRNKTDGIEISQPTTQSERNRIADRAESAMNLSIEMAVDTMDDKTATAYAVGDGVPAYVIGRDGKILFHQSYLEPMALGQAIENATK